MLEAGKNFGRYLDVDGDGIPWRTIPARTRPRAPSSAAAPRATPTPSTARRAPTTSTTWSACGASWRPRKKLVPAPVLQPASQPTRFGAIYYGSTSPAMAEALPCSKPGRPCRCAARARLPFADEVIEFIDDHDEVFVVEQNESGQLRMLLLTEGEIDPKKLIRSCTMTARRSPPASFPAGSPMRCPNTR
jgi:2-oxoglutarate ferredoxin oxidoreductase subunit alpha